MSTFEIIGFAGIVLNTSAYLPQLIRIWKTKDVGGISIVAWLAWLVGNSMVLVHALTTTDLVFISFQIVNILLILIVIILTAVYRKTERGGNIRKLNFLIF